MSRDPYAPPESEEEQFNEVARILGRALHRWHRLNRSKTVELDRSPDQPGTRGVPQLEALAETEQFTAPID